MKLEILFPEVCNLYGDRGNITLLEKCFPTHDFIYTSLLDEPYFVHHDVNFIYLGPMSDSMQEKVIQKLMPYQKRIKELIEHDVVFLFTGNALEILGKEIIDESGKSIHGLNIFNIMTKKTPNQRYNSLVLGSIDEHKIVSYVSTSSTSVIHEPRLMDVLKEKNNSNEEGIHVHNFFGTYLLGPLLVLNPYFTKTF